VLQKLCAAIIHFLGFKEENHHAHFNDMSQQLCQSLLATFCFLGDSGKDLNVKDVILEALTLFSPATLKSSFQILQEDTQFQIDAKVDEDIARSVSQPNSS